MALIFESDLVYWYTLAALTIVGCYAAFKIGMRHGEERQRKKSDNLNSN